MNTFQLTATLFSVASLAYGSSCSNAPLTTYLNGGNLYSCTESGGNLTVTFNDNVVPAYVGLNLLSNNNSAADPSTINVVAGNPGLEFDSAGFSEQSALLSSQAEVVHFFLDGGTNPITATTLSLLNVATSTGGLGLGTGLAIGQELLCVGGQFTSLPTGLVTSVANGVLGTGQFGCNGTVLVGTAASSSGPLSVITSVLGLPNLSGLSDQATIQLTPTDPTDLDVIKLQALISVTGGSASDTGFGNTYALGSSVPEPSSARLIFGAMIVAGIVGMRRLRPRTENS
jgi:hypothetical protein